MWFVIIDEDGPFMTEAPGPGDRVVFKGDLEDAETVLCRECQGWEDEHPEMNEDFQ